MIAGQATVIVVAIDPVQPNESVAVMVNDLDPSESGIPLIAPPVVKVNPAGTDPAVTAYEYGDLPPEALTDFE